MRPRSESIKSASTTVFSLILIVSSPQSLTAIESCSSNLLPIIVITKPTNGQVFTYGATVRIQATASDPDGSIIRVEFYADTNYLGSTTTAPYTNNWLSLPWPELPNIPYLLTARAIDDCGVISTSSPVAVYSIQDIAPPRVVIEKPLEGALYRPAATIQLVVSLRTWDGSENPISFYDGESLVGTAPEPPYSLVLSNLVAGTHVITARNTDDFLQTGTSRPVTVTVADLLLSSPRLDLEARFRFNATGVVTGSPLVLLGSSNLVIWEAIETNVPTSPVVELKVGPPNNQPQRFFRVQSDK